MIAEKEDYSTRDGGVPEKSGGSDGGRSLVFSH